MPLKVESARRWLRGQQEAQALNERERRAYLSSLSAEKALRLYLSLISCPTGWHDLESPSAILQAMRSALRRQRHSGSA